MNDYDDYMYGMRNYNMMGYNMNDPMMNANFMNNNSMNNNYINYNMQSNMNNIESMYPEMYNRIYPLVVKACDSIRYTTMGNNVISRSMIDDLTQNIYLNIADSDMLSEDEESNENCNSNSDKNSESNCRNRKPNILRDLIKILLIRELVRRGYNTYNPYGYRPY